MGTIEAMELANPDAFQQLTRIDPGGKFWNSTKFQDVFGYKRPIGRSDEGYKLLASIERDSAPDQVRIRKRKEKVEKERNDIKNKIRRERSILDKEVVRFSKMNMS